DYFCATLDNSLSSVLF
nr:immunoglobulin light chain junction region [Macaca mulatta]